MRSFVTSSSRRATAFFSGIMSKPMIFCATEYSMLVAEGGRSGKRKLAENFGFSGSDAST